MRLVDITKRQITRVNCRYCGSTNEVWFDEKHDEYLCVRCLLKEREKINLDNEDDEDKMNDRMELRNK